MSAGADVTFAGAGDGFEGVGADAPGARDEQAEAIIAVTSSPDLFIYSYSPRALRYSNPLNRSLNVPCG
jgi:hypothetical protein